MCPLLCVFFPAAENLIEHQIKKAVDFEIDEHRKRLAEVEAAVNPGVAPVSDTAGAAVIITCHPTDRVELVDLARTSDVGFSKVVTVLTALIDEVSFLRHHAEKNYYAQLSLFGHSKEDDSAEYTDGVLEAMVGKMMAFFKDCDNFRMRCAALAKAMVQQFSALYGRVRRWDGGGLCSEPAEVQELGSGRQLEAPASFIVGNPLLSLALLRLALTISKRGWRSILR